MLDTHSEAIQNVNEAHHTFLLRYRQDRRILYGIVEGKDDPMFYRGLIERFLPDDWSVDLILAGKKSKVIDLHENLDWTTFSKQQVAFFIDRDFSRYGVDIPPSDTNIYVTDGYSIENDIAGADVLIRLLVEAYNVVDFSVEEGDNLKILYNGALEDFQDFMAPIMGQILGWRRNSIKANLDNLNLPPLIKFQDGKMIAPPEMAVIKKRIEHLCACVGAECFEDAALVALEEEFRHQNGASRFTRGKYVVWFLSQYLVHIHKNIDKFVSAYSNPPKVKLPVGPANVMVLAAPRARIPNSLKIFIESTFLSFIKLKS